MERNQWSCGRHHLTMLPQIVSMKLNRQSVWLFEKGVARIRPHVISTSLKKVFYCTIVIIDIAMTTNSARPHSIHGRH